MGKEQSKPTILSEVRIDEISPRPNWTIRISFDTFKYADYTIREFLEYYKIHKNDKSIGNTDYNLRQFGLAIFKLAECGKFPDLREGDFYEEFNDCEEGH